MSTGSEKESSNPPGPLSNQPNENNGSTIPISVILGNVVNQTEIEKSEVLPPAEVQPQVDDTSRALDGPEADLLESRPAGKTSIERCDSSQPSPADESGELVKTTQGSDEREDRKPESPGSFIPKSSVEVQESHEHRGADEGTVQHKESVSSPERHVDPNSTTTDVRTGSGNDPESHLETDPDRQTDSDKELDFENNPFSKETGGDSSSRPSTLDEGPVSEMSAQKIWERQKETWGEKNEALDKIMQLVGLENVKHELLRIKEIIETARLRKVQLRRQLLNLALLGNPGTGKTILAQMYKDFLVDCGVRMSDNDVEIVCISGARIQSGSDLEDMSKSLEEPDSSISVIFIDDIDRMSPDLYERFLSVLADLSDSAVFVVAGSLAGATKVLGSQPHGRWLFWRRLELKDYDDEQLRLILLRLIHYNKLEIDGGAEVDCARVAAKRVARGRGAMGFGNVHSLRLAFEQMLARQADRLAKTKAEVIIRQNSMDKIAVMQNMSTGGNNVESVGSIRENNRANGVLAEERSGGEERQPDSHFLTMEDILGMEPADTQSESTAWKKLEKMAGLHSVKKEIGILAQQARANFKRELRGQKLLKRSLNRVFLGPPGTGKTTVAKLYGEVLTELGFLSTKEVVFKTPSDFIGQYIGESEMRSTEILDEAVGKVLIIDDAHMFYNRGDTDEYRLGCIDVIVSRIQNRPGEDRCVILVGYAREMEEMFQKCNPGLQRRFPLEEAFRFEDYDDETLYQIMQIKMEEDKIKAEKPAMDVAKEVLRRARDRPNFGNGGAIDNLLNQAKARFRERSQARSSETGIEAIVDAEDDEDYIILEPQDFDPESDRGWKPDIESSLFDGLFGFDHIIEQFQDYQTVAAHMRQRGKNPREVIPFTFVFKGPPGTGKTHVARIIGKIFYRLGFLSSDEVIECSASELIGQYRGHTAPKVINLLDRALGMVLFIDEAYRLGAGAGRTRGGSFEEEAVGELVDCMTKPKYLCKMIVVLAGYGRDMDKLLNTNAGLRGRFPTEISFKPMEPEICLAHLQNLLAEQDIGMPDKAKANADDIEKVYRLFDKLGKTAGWSNGRDVQTLARVITTQVLRDIPLSEEQANKDDKVTYLDGKGDEASMNDTNVPKLVISTDRLIGALKDLLRQRIRGGSV